MLRRYAPLLAATALGLAVLTGCSGGSGDEKDARDSTPTSPSRDAAATPTADDSGSAGPSGSPDFGPSDYTYRLRVLCYCPQSGPVEVTVVDDAVSSAVMLSGPSRGSKAPEFARLSIDDILEAAAEAEARGGSADVTWPAGSDHPTSVRIDRIANAVDDEVTYTIARVVLSAG